MFDAMQMEALFDAARDASHRAYAPYSAFPVGAAILTSSGTIYSGCNVENAAYPVGICAEAGAIATMVAQGEQQIAGIAIYGARANPCMPCGACRQRISEFSNPTTVVITQGHDGALQEHRIAELLPHAFGPRQLASTL
jgi:cytidine deaminase